MNFIKKPISSEPGQFSRLKNFFRSKKPDQDKFLVIGFISFTTVIIVLMMGWMMFGLAKNTNKIAGLIPSFLTKEIATDSYNHTNFLLLGIGGAQHEGSNLTDTIIIASLDHTTNHLGLLSLPRDLWIKSPVGDTRINNIYEFAQEKYGDSNKALEILKNTVEDIVGLEIHYYVKIDFDGVVQAIDAVDGLDIYLDKPFYDPLYPKGETTLYETFYLPPGQVHLDGETALKYIRSRHTTSDFDRSNRQQQILSLLKDKALNVKLLAHPGQVQALYESLQQHLETNLTIKELLYMAKIADKFSTNSLASAVINDNPISIGGFVYTPERKYYGGAYVLVPHTNDFSEIRDFADYILLHTDLFKERNNYPIQILNVSGGSGLGGLTKQMLDRHGFSVIRYGNGKNQTTQTTTIYYKDSAQKPAIINELIKYIPAQVSNNVPPEYLVDPYLSDAPIIIELGKDYLEYYKQNRRRFY